jgi:hypothetical protein
MNSSYIVKDGGGLLISLYYTQWHSDSSVEWVTILTMQSNISMRCKFHQFVISIDKLFSVPFLISVGGKFIFGIHPVTKFVIMFVLHLIFFFSKLLLSGLPATLVIILTSEAFIPGISHTNCIVMKYMTWRRFSTVIYELWFSKK